jgi:hypothetical protein
VDILLLLALLLLLFLFVNLLILNLLILDSAINILFLLKLLRYFAKNLLKFNILKITLYFLFPDLFKF